MNNGIIVAQLIFIPCIIIHTVDVTGNIVNKKVRIPKNANMPTIIFHNNPLINRKYSRLQTIIITTLISINYEPLLSIG